MITTTMPVSNICKSQAIALGRQMEDNYRQIIFDCSEFDEEITSIMLVHQRSKDVAPYIVDNVSGTSLTWNIDNTDTAFYGYGKAELRISFANGLAKSVTMTTMVIKSITGDTVIPTALQSWYDAMIDYIDDHAASPEQIEAAVEAYLEEHPIPAPVTSVNSKTGDVVLTASDVGALSSSTTFVSSFNNQTGAVTYTAPVTSVNNKTGAVTLTASDVSALPSSTTIPTKTSQLQNDSGFITSVPVTSVNSKTGAVSLSASDVGALASNTSYVASFNGSTGAVTYSAPVTSVDGKTGSVTVIPTGGTTGQVLAKKSNTDRDVEWQTVSSGGAVSSVNGKTGAVTLTASDVGALSSSTTFVSSFNGNTGAVTYTAPVTSVNTQTGAVVIGDATTSSAGLMSATDKSHLDTVYADYSSAITALGVE